MNRIRLNPHSSCIFGCGYLFPSIQDKHIIPFVVLLLDIGNPSYVSWLVITFTVNPVETKAFRPATNMFKESYKTIEPFLADRNPSTAIIWIGANIWVAASIFHIDPCTIFRSVFHPMLGNKTSPNAHV
ncbi:hypothetical protein DVA43_08760 [Leclercia sp. W6]|nr:hypothetical protein DVA43_08760 [Leclercia sp. W6]